ncbi:class I SAM-dependent methyltransferase [Algibacter aquimarinus]|uniref:Methyltransferase type 11 domain-containing protein n=1 Tax=Algibacter aquimarinus TaxID=1136748 RepID=A0ABP9HM95_9FLAO
MSVKYDKIGINYNRTRKADPYLVSKLIENLQPDKNKIYLDIGCGTGNYTSALQKRGFKFIGIDPSKEMLEKAKVKNPHIDWRIGTSENTGLENNTIDGIMGSLTIHHWSDLDKAFSELFRILKRDGEIVIFTSTPKQMKGYWLNHYFPKMMNDSICQMPSLEVVTSAMTKAGFKLKNTEKYNIKPDLEDQFLYCGKQNPELYFNTKIRHGISSFSSLANKEEVEAGLLKLRSDIDKGKIADVMKAYKNNLGDYLYIIGKKH